MNVIKHLTVFLTLAAFAATAASIASDTVAAQRQSYYEVGRDGRYVMRYETPGGIIHYETGYQRVTVDGRKYQVKEGYYIYPTPDGRKVRLSYFADIDGFRILSFDIRESKAEADEFHHFMANMDSNVGTTEQSTLK